MKEIYLAAGCFWGAEQYFSSIYGVADTEVGYANGQCANPSYEQVCREGTGHAETVKVAYDESKVSLAFLLELFYEAIDPTAVNRQGGDVGRQYRTGIYYTDPADLPVIQASLAALAARLTNPMAIEAEPLQGFWPAEEYHQKYLEKNPGGYCHIGPAQFRRAAAARMPPPARPGREELQKKLTPLQYEVTQNAATEPPFQNEFWDDHRRGLYVDIITGEPLFVSADKFDSGCGWPSFSRPVKRDALVEKTDRSHGIERTEVRGAASDAHLGHVFTDGPRKQGGLRYCINSAALRFVPEEQMEAEGYGEWLQLVK